MADKYLYRNLTTGRVTERAATVASGGAASAGDIVALDNSGRLDQSVLPVGIGADLKILVASEGLTAGDFVFVTPTGGVAKASAASGGNQADGFVLASVASSASVAVYFEGTNTALQTLTPGARYYLSDTIPGGVTSSPVDGAGKLHQYLGKAISATELTFEAEDSIVLA